jgi:multiple sugar transport system permease protein
MTVGLQVFNTSFYIEYTLITAGALISLLPLIIMFLLLQRWVMQGMVMTGLKG